MQNCNDYTVLIACHATSIQMDLSFNWLSICQLAQPGWNKAFKVKADHD